MQCACAVLYCHLWPVRLYHIFAHELISGTILEGELPKIEICVLISLQLLSEIFLIIIIIQRYATINAHPFYVSICYSSHILITLEVSRQGFEKYCNIKFHGNPSGGSRFVGYGRTDGLKDRRTHRQTWRKLTDPFRNCAKGPKIKKLN